MKQAFSKIWIIVILIILVLIAGGIFAWQYFGASKEKVKAPAKEVVKDETANWKTYKNEEYGFEIKYPPNFFTEDETNGIEFIEEQWKGQKVHFPFIGIEFIKTPLTPQQWVAEKGTEVSLVEEPPPGFQSSKYQYFGVKDKITKTIGTPQVFQFYSAAVSSGTNHTLIRQKDNTLIDIYRHSSGMGEVSKDIYNQTLSTFRFLK